MLKDINAINQGRIERPDSRVIRPFHLILFPSTASAFSDWYWILHNGISSEASRCLAASLPRLQPGINVIFTLSLARNEIDSNREISKNLFPGYRSPSERGRERERDEFREQLSSPAVRDVHTTGRRIPPGTYARRCRCNLVSRREIARK